MGTADELRTRAQKFYALARVASNRVTKLQLICLGDDYLHQAAEMTRERVMRDISAIAADAGGKHQSLSS